MATANEIFAATIEEPHIVVGSDRKIKVPDSLKRLGVQFDHNIETVTFDCPRYWDNHDMSEMAVYINYMLSNGYADSYPADNVKADGDIMHFTWTISRNVTQVAGSINFLVCVKNADGNGKEINHWNSELCQDAYISKGMENEEMPISEQSDLITSLLLRMDSVEKINIKADAMQTLFEETQAVAATAELVKEEALDASDYIKNSYANAIKGNASGEVIRVDDVSPIQHTINTKVYGKNLFDITKVAVGDPSKPCAITEVTDNHIVITTSSEYDGNGHCASSNTFREMCPQVESGKEYVITATSPSYMQSAYFSKADVYWDFGKSLVITDELLDCRFDFYGLSFMKEQGTGDCIISNIQIEEGAVATEYEPYIDPTTVTVTGCGKNLFDVSKIISTGGVINNGDGSLYIKTGATTSGINCYKTLRELAPYLKVGDICTLSAITTGSDKHIYLNKYGKTWPFGTAKQITSDMLESSVYFYQSGSSTEGTVRNIQIELGELSTKYEPFAGGEYTPDTDGIANVTSIAPTTIIRTNTPGVTIEAKYNRDTTKMFESYVLTDEAKNEIAGLITDEIMNKASAAVMYEMQGELNSISDLIGGA